jgi:hypothetical protein
MSETDGEESRIITFASRYGRRYMALLAGLAVGVSGIVLLTGTQAATPFITAEAEQGARTAPAAIVTDSTASGGSAVRFTATDPHYPQPVACVAVVPGAGAGAVTKGPTTYNSSGTTTVSNVIFDGSHSDDLVRVYTGKVIFDRVTFRGIGTGTSGHTLEIKQGGSVEIRNSVFEGKPAEDTIQTSGNGQVTIECNHIGGSPGEDHIDTKPGGEVIIRSNTFTNPATYQTIQNHNASGLVHTIGNTGIDKIFYELPDGHDPALYKTTGTIVGNNVRTYIWLYDVTNVLVERNTVPELKHGDSTGRWPKASYLKDNNITTMFRYNGGTCYKSGNTGVTLNQCTVGAPSWY